MGDSTGSSMSTDDTVIADVDSIGLLSSSDELADAVGTGLVSVDSLALSTLLRLDFLVSPARN